MSAEVAHNPDAAAGSMMQKRKIDEEAAVPDAKKFMTDAPPVTTVPYSVAMPSKTASPLTKAREVRLEQNRKAARESRRRKKVSYLLVACVRKKFYYNFGHGIHEFFFDYLMYFVILRL
jgi:hypothetical protein